MWAARVPPAQPQPAAREAWSPGPDPPRGPRSLARARSSLRKVASACGSLRGAGACLSFPVPSVPLTLRQSTRPARVFSARPQRPGALKTAAPVPDPLSEVLRGSLRTQLWFRALLSCPHQPSAPCIWQRPLSHSPSSLIVTIFAQPGLLLQHQAKLGGGAKRRSFPTPGRRARLSGLCRSSRSSSGPGRGSCGV